MLKFSLHFDKQNYVDFFGLLLCPILLLKFVRMRVTRLFMFSIQYGSVYTLGVTAEVMILKTKVKTNIVHRWSRVINLYHLSEEVLELTCDVAIDRIFYLLSRKHVHIYDVISDALGAARAHLSA